MDLRACSLLLTCLAMSGCATGPDLNVLLTGQIVATGRELGALSLEMTDRDRDYVRETCYRTGPDGRSVRLLFELSGIAEIQVPPDAESAGVDVSFPWSHVVLRPADCRHFEAKVVSERTRLDPANPRSEFRVQNRGFLGLACAVPGSDYSIQVRVDFHGCDYEGAGST